ncbi:hypothetical protein D0Z00_004249 [Geotrichum galactomycetum]|uniref:Uncharacterized protein n=1 Tax=Geotrichum galactomycetum TaxID=27317 RepID=A0ACB6UYW3_9ASCO|nr:hypothetical protein D0Z00_004249 [Geotrichum candidum]
MTDIRLTLNNGTTIPALGLGTWQSPKGEVAAAVEYALTQTGIRHIDAAYVYQNEQEVGEGIKKAIESGKVTREEIFVTTKVFPSYHTRVAESLDKSLKNLGLDYVDLLLIHWPVGFNPNGNHELFPRLEDGTTIDLDPSFDVVKTWKQFEAVYKTGKTKAIGVSNFSIAILEDLLPHVEVVPAVDQIESHPFLAQPELVAFAKSKGILIEAYSPLGSTGGPLLKLPEIVKIAEKHNASPASVLISWHLKEGRIVLPKSVTPARISSNTIVVSLDKDDLEVLDSLHKTHKPIRNIKPAWGANRLKFPDWTE